MERADAGERAVRGSERAGDVFRRSILQSSALAVTGLGAAGGALATRPTNATGASESTSPESGDTGSAGSGDTAKAGEARTWMTDEVPDKPLRNICIPGTHHAPMHDCGANYWWHTQRRDMREQLEDGIRYLDVRPGVYYEQETLVESGVADQMSTEWQSLIDEAGGIANLVPDIGGIDPAILDFIGTLLEFDDPAWVANQYVGSCADAAETNAERQLPLEALLVRVFTSLFARDGFDVPTFGLDLSTMRLDQSADVDVDHDGFRAHHGGQRANPYDWGVDLGGAFGRVRAYLDAIAADGASEIVILNNRFFWDLLNVELTAAQWQSYRDLLDSHLGEYVLDLGAYDPAALADLSPSDLDGPRVAVLFSGPGTDESERPPWAGDGAYLTKFFGGPTEPGNVLDFAVSHTETASHDPATLDWVEFQVTPDNQTVIDVTIETIDFRTEYDSRRMYANLAEAAQRTNSLLGGYAAAVKRNPEQNPNLISLDFYDTSRVVAYCRELSREGFINGDATVEGPPIESDTYRLRVAATGRVLTAGEPGLVTEAWDSPETQEFSLVPNEDGTYRIERAGGDSALTAATGTENGSGVSLSSWSGDEHQRWYVVELDGNAGEYGIISAATGLALDAADDYDGQTDGDALQWHFHGEANQRWRLVAQPEPVVGDARPRDLDGDGRYENVRGDGQPDIADVQALFDNLGSPAVQENAPAFNFQGANPDEVTIFDVQALFEQLRE